MTNYASSGCSTTLSDEDSGSVPILRPETRVYTRRWYMLTIFSLAGFIQNSSWNTWGPIALSAEAALDWTDSEIGNMANIGNVGIFLGAIPFSYIMDVKGMRISMLLATFLIAMAATIRCFTLENHYVTWIAAVSALLNGAPAVVPFGGCSLFSSLWFPMSQRATATGLASFAYYLGMAMSFIIGPLFVRSPEYGASVDTGRDNYSAHGILNSTETSYNHTVVTNIKAMKTDIFSMLYYYAAISSALFVLVIIYFPEKPPIPPTVSASKDRTPFIQGLSHVICNGSAWLIVLGNGLTAGVIVMWGSLLDVILKPLPVSQSVAGYIGFWQTLAGSVAGIAIARFADLFSKKMKMFLILSVLCAVGAAVWFILICQQYIAYDIVSLYTSAIGFGVFIYGCNPLFFELACEVIYPVSESVAGGFITLANNVIGTMYLLIMYIPNIGNSWQNWALLGSFAIALPMLCVLPERYKRSDLDLTGDVKAAVKGQ